MLSFPILNAPFVSGNILFTENNSTMHFWKPLSKLRAIFSYIHTCPPQISNPVISFLTLVFFFCPAGGKPDDITVLLSIVAEYTD